MEADSWFPNLDEDPDWEITADSDEQYYFDLTYHFLAASAKRAGAQTAAVAVTSANRPQRPLQNSSPMKTTPARSRGESHG